MMQHISSITYRVTDTIGRAIKMPGVSVLVYHSMKSSPKDPYGISASEFAIQMDRLSKTTQFLSLDTLVTAHKNGESLTGTVITFDDGYKSVLSIIPTLEKYAIPATVFVLSSPSNANRKELVQTEELLTVADMKKLIRAGVTIGSHSRTHADFSTLPIEQIYSEVTESKKILEERVGRNVDYFAYPKGRYTPLIVQAVRAAGYKAAFSVAHACVTVEHDIYTLPRMIIDTSYERSHFPSRISPGMQIMRHLYEKN